MFFGDFVYGVFQLGRDVGDDEVAVGDRAVVFGDPSHGAPSVEDWARAADTINYEIVTRLGGKIEWTYAARD